MAALLGSLTQPEEEVRSMEQETGAKYEIESYDGDRWSSEYVGRTGNEFDTYAEAMAGIDALRALGPEWEWEPDEETGEPSFEHPRQYRVVQV